jgi:adenylate kinase
VGHVSAGELLRAEARAGTPAGREVAGCLQRGDLVPDAIVFDVLTPAVAAESLTRLSDRSSIRERS